MSKRSHESAIIPQVQKPRKETKQSTVRIFNTSTSHSLTSVIKHKIILLFIIINEKKEKTRTVPLTVTLRKT